MGLLGLRGISWINGSAKFFGGLKFVILFHPLIVAMHPLENVI